MADAIEVASFALERLESASTMKLQKIVYYSQAFNLVKNEAPLFLNRIEAWRNGPVIPDLYYRHAHEFVISEGFFNVGTDGLSDLECSAIEYVVSKLGDMSGQELSELTHSEAPWCEARVGIAPTDPSNNEITQESILRYYSSPDCKNPVFI